MSKPTILIIDDQRDVLTAVRKDLSVFEDVCSLVECESSAEAKEVLEEIDAECGHAAVVVCDHIMANQNGVDFLVELKADTRFKYTRKLLLTGLATHQDTITAINMARIDQYIEKPWDPAHLQETVRILLTHYLLARGVEYTEYMSVMHQPTLLEALKNRT